jgi:small subunit ribosomal protein S8
MPVTDPIADMLTRIRNANTARHERVLIPASKLKLEIAKVLKGQGYVRKYDLVDDKRHGQIRVHLRYDAEGTPAITGLRRVSRPGMRVYVDAKRVPRVMGGLGVSVLSTSRGVLADREARRQGLGGEVLCYVW